MSALPLPEPESRPEAALPDAPLPDADAALLCEVIERLLGRTLDAPAGVLGVSATGLEGDADESMKLFLQARNQLEALITIVGTKADDTGESWSGFRSLLRSEGKASEAEVRAANYAGMCTRQYPVLARHWAAGFISGAQVRTIGRLVAKLPYEHREEAVVLLADHAPGLTAAELTRASKVLLNAVAPGFEERAAERAEEDSFLQISPDLTGYRVVGHLTNEQAAWAMTTLDALTGVIAADDKRTKSQRQAEAFVTIMRQYAASDVIPQLAMARPQFIIVGTASDLLAIAHDAAPGDLPVTAWNDTISPSTARRLLSEADLVPLLVADSTQEREDAKTLVDLALDEANAERVRVTATLLRKRRRSQKFAERGAPPVFLRLLTTPVVPLAIGNRVRTVPEKLRLAVTARDQHCVVDGCTMPVHRCEIHHVKPWALGGLTQLDNLATLCVRHHRTVENGTWRLRRRTPADRPGRYWVAEPIFGEIRRSARWSA